MQDDANLVTPTPKRASWNKGKLVGAKPPLRAEARLGKYAPCSKLSAVNATWRCSILRSTVNCGAATLSQLRSIVSLPMVTQLIGQRCVRERPGDPFDLN